MLGPSVLPSHVWPRSTRGQERYVRQDDVPGMCGLPPVTPEPCLIETKFKSRTGWELATVRASRLDGLGKEGAHEMCVDTLSTFFFFFFPLWASI